MYLKGVELWVFLGLSITLYFLVIICNYKGMRGEYVLSEFAPPRLSTIPETACQILTNWDFMKLISCRFCFDAS